MDILIGSVISKSVLTGVLLQEWCLLTDFSWTDHAIQESFRLSFFARTGNCFFFAYIHHKMSDRFCRLVARFR